MNRSSRSAPPAKSAIPIGPIPSPTASLDAICAFAHKVDGYELAGSLELCAAIHDAIRERFDAGLPLEADLDELRCALFFAHRAEWHNGLPLDATGVAFVRALLEGIRATVGEDGSKPPDLDTDHSSFREKMLEHAFVSELLQEAWFRYRKTMEVLRAEVDSSGYDLVLEFGGVLRHVQLKSSRADAKTAKQKLSTKLAEKPSGCVVWIVYREDPSRARVSLRYRFFGEAPGAPLPELGDSVAKHSKGNALGVKTERPGLRTVGINKFSEELDLQQLFRRLFVTEKG